MEFNIGNNGTFSHVEPLRNSASDLPKPVVETKEGEVSTTCSFPDPSLDECVELYGKAGNRVHTLRQEIHALKSALSAEQEKLKAAQHTAKELRGPLEYWQKKSRAEQARREKAEEALKAVREHLQWVYEHVGQFGKSSNTSVVWTRTGRMIVQIDSALLPKEQA